MDPLNSIFFPLLSWFSPEKKALMQKTIHTWQAAMIIIRSCCWRRSNNKPLHLYNNNISLLIQNSTTDSSHNVMEKEMTLNDQILVLLNIERCKSWQLSSQVKIQFLETLIYPLRHINLSSCLIFFKDGLFHIDPGVLTVPLQLLHDRKTDNLGHREGNTVVNVTWANTNVKSERPFKKRGAAEEQQRNTMLLKSDWLLNYPVLSFPLFCMCTKLLSNKYTLIWMLRRWDAALLLQLLPHDQYFSLL